MMIASSPNNQIANTVAGVGNSTGRAYLLPHGSPCTSSMWGVTLAAFGFALIPDQSKNPASGLGQVFWSLVAPKVRNRILVAPYLVRHLQIPVPSFIQYFGQSQSRLSKGFWLSKLNINHVGLHNWFVSFAFETSEEGNHGVGNYIQANGSNDQGGWACV